MRAAGSARTAIMLHHERSSRCAKLQIDEIYSAAQHLQTCNGFHIPALTASSASSKGLLQAGCSRSQPTTAVPALQHIELLLTVYEAVKL